MLKVIWWSTIPYSNAGYGVATRELLRRFRNEGHQVQIGTKHFIGGQVEVDGVTCFDGIELGMVNAVQIEDKYDYIISMADDWTLPQDFRFNKWVNVCFLDTHEMHSRLLNGSKKALHTIAVTKFTHEQLKKNGVESFYAPLGVDTSSFKPDSEKRKKFRDARGLTDDQFVIGTLGINYSSDRKNFIPLIRAFAEFYKRHPDSVLYLHTDVMGTSTAGLPLTWVMESLGFSSKDKGAIRYVSQKDYHKWSLSEEAVVQTYNGFDVFCFPTNGEGFGFPIVESQACGTPVITVDTTSGKELMKGGWLIDVDQDDIEFSTHLCWFARVRQSKIEDALEKAYIAWKSGDIKEIGMKAREGVMCYDWDVVYRDYWKPVFDFLDKENQGKIVKIDKYPNWKQLYEGFGEIYKITNCEDFPHDGPRSCDEMVKELPRLLGEPEEDPRSILIRSYPLFPDDNGEFYVNTRCEVHKFLPPRFIKQCKAKYKIILSYPKVRNEIKECFNKFVKDSPDYIKLSDVEQEFDADYKKQLQTHLKTMFSFTPTIKSYLEECDSFLDVGCGDGRFVKALIASGKTAQGVEVNPAWINGEEIIYGNALSLPFVDNSVDCVMCIDVLEHVTSPIRAIEELVRVARKKIVIQITSINNLCFEEDPTHIVEWEFSQWLRELNEFGDIPFAMLNGPETVEVIIVEKRHV